MRLILDEEQRRLADSVRALLADHCPPQRVREVMADDGAGIDRRLWTQLAELGVTGLLVPEAAGGAGAGHVDRCVVLAELGAALAPVPYLASAVLATDAAIALGDDTLAEDLLPEIAAGQQTVAVAVADAGGRWGSAADSVQAARDGGHWRLAGEAAFVVDGPFADHVLVYADHGWFVVDGGAVSWRPSRTLDPTRRMARAEFARTSARYVPCADPAGVLEAVWQRAAVALAAEQLGGMRRVLDDTVEYAKVRVQFGRPIGSQQAVKHACADLYASCEQAEAVLWHAAWTADHDPAALPEAAALAQVVLGPAAFDTAASGLQLHGGIGYTWEHDAHLYYKRAKTSELLLGTPAEHRARLADALSI
ncbi:MULTISPECIES: acyl-CoA dehydrogenase family protein [Prauserella salsuginis group]|uniref:Acyl-CoA dehydrogenase family protein n=1 Tax=Prauserella salsuginis TaxID=387889 RepID=A0ABW6G3D6_9PSEU|nr:MULTISPECIES: acyl-CoA dehydrogenase family protein [Prauserella salsuginis group]MCR3718589.1 acyl-CoA dehydrogenase [Prauserella flava]MCR3733159.1 acyl-CoA dehydrogenase [Prauserella salsuginis]